jgi:alkylhydroperoxidase family enzyme
MALIPYPADEDLDPRAAAVMAQLPIRLNLFSMLANAPALMGPTLQLGQAILAEGDLDPKLRELVILAVSDRTETAYEWAQHDPIARAIGVPAAQIDAIAAGRTAGPEFDEVETLVLEIVAAVTEGGTPLPALITRADTELGRAATLEVLLVAGFYAMVGGLIRAVQLDVDAVDAAQTETVRGRLGG